MSAFPTPAEYSARIDEVRNRLVALMKKHPGVSAAGDMDAVERLVTCQDWSRIPRCNFAQGEVALREAQKILKGER